MNNTEKKAERTPGKWRLEACSQYKGQHVLHDSRFLMADDPENEGEELIIAKFRDGNLADRTFIVTACNSHDPLVSACNLVLNTSLRDGDLEHDEVIISLKALKAVENALRSAGVEV